MTAAYGKAKMLLSLLAAGLPVKRQGKNKTMDKRWIEQQQQAAKKNGPLWRGFTSEATGEVRGIAGRGKYIQEMGGSNCLDFFCH